MPRPIPTSIGHFTHIDHLPTIAIRGLMSDTRAQADGLLTTEAGNMSIKARRRERPVSAGAGGFVSDYVPFYFKSRSPMLYSIHRGNVPTFTGNEYDLVYLLTTVESLIERGIRPVFTDRNAALAFCKHSDLLADLDTLVDWDVMDATMWANTPDDPDRMERRMAECLVYDHVPWDTFSKIAVYDEARAERVRSALSTLDVAGHDVVDTTRG
ncbi:type II toxin-antitoxin system toxin DNA ADP-ribosyl transferase DarT [Rhodococcus pyridinivorans]|uniref:type II toxin-antitoxin system toxin DNA ADP-ribosyl transferase DarT n=1 Tax=Rhodococcus pyridinivorans TaxID=103816 RepID=UPI0026584233|nr:DUF4433 domain-containing protein [Rhodococcus pyridinivorans]